MRRLPHARFECGSPESPGERVTFFCFAKRKSPKKRRPPVCDPCASLRGKPASGRLRGAPWNSLRCGAASFRQPRRVSSRSMGAPTPMLTPQPPRRRRSQQGGAAEHPNSRTSIRAIAALGPVCAARGASARETGPSAAQRSNGPCGCLLPGFPSGCAWRAQGAGWHARRSARASCSSSPWLSERCAQRKASSTAHPVTEHPRLPRSAAQGPQTVGAPFLW